MLTPHHYYHKNGSKDGHWLLYDHYYGPHDYGFTIHVMPLFESEKFLSGGRFHRYSSSRQRYEVRLQFPASDAATQQKVVWIAENAEATWNVDIDYKDMNTALLVFSFISIRDAFLFKMMFGSNFGLAN